MDTYNKYLKYKQKYLNLRQNKSSYKFEKFVGGEKVCHRNAYTQHKGECWMDAILAIFTYAEKNNIGSIVQDKLTTWFKNIDKIDTILGEFVNDLITNKHNRGLPVNINVNIEEDKAFRQFLKDAKDGNVDVVK